MHADSLPKLRTSLDAAFIRKDVTVKLTTQSKVDPRNGHANISQPTIIGGNIQGISIDPDQGAGYLNVNGAWEALRSDMSEIQQITIPPINYVKLIKKRETLYYQIV